jgi:hypothetical protein
MSDWLRGLGFTPPVQKTNLNSSNSVNTGASTEGPSLLSGNAGVDSFKRTTPLFSGHADVGNLVKTIGQMSPNDAAAHLNPTTTAGLKNAAHNPNFAFPPING